MALVRGEEQWPQRLMSAAVLERLNKSSRVVISYPAASCVCSWFIPLPYPILMTLLIQLLTLVWFAGVGQAVLQAQLITYAESQQDFPNPERGFYIPISTSSARFVPLDAAQLTQYRTQARPVAKASYDSYFSLVYRSYRLDTFRDRPLSADFLHKIRQDLITARQAGVKLILRFAYTEQANPGNCPDQYNICPPYGDAPKAIVLSHIRQLSPLLHQQADVIAVLQMGFIGIWGENYFTDYFGDASTNSLGVVPDSSWQDRQQVLAALLSALPRDRMVQVRTPQIKQRFVGGPRSPVTAPAMAARQAYNFSDRARIGFHNDCFLASADDYGTFYDVGNSRAKRGPATAPLRRYMAQDSRYTAVGGETCDDAFSPQNDCAPLGRAEQEMALMHYSYLNASYNNEVNNDWQAQGCMDNIRRRLGYRFVLRSARIARHSRVGQPVGVDIVLANVGYAALYNPRPLLLILRNTATGRLHRITLVADMRRLGPGSHRIHHPLKLPAALQAGQYELLLHLPDGYRSLAHNPAYSIRLANRGLWEERTGFNKLNHCLLVGP